MSENPAQDGAPARSIAVRSFGDTADEIELFALDEARKVFGADVQLAVTRDYAINGVETSGARGASGADKRYTALVTVRETGPR